MQVNEEYFRSKAGATDILRGRIPKVALDAERWEEARALPAADPRPAGLATGRATFIR